MIVHEEYRTQREILWRQVTNVLGQEELGARRESTRNWQQFWGLQENERWAVILRHKIFFGEQLETNKVTTRRWSCKIKEINSAEEGKTNAKGWYMKCFFCFLVSSDFSSNKTVLMIQWVHQVSHTTWLLLSLHTHACKTVTQKYYCGHALVPVWSGDQAHKEVIIWSELAL